MLVTTFIISSSLNIDNEEKAKEISEQANQISMDSLPPPGASIMCEKYAAEEKECIIP